MNCVRNVVLLLLLSSLCLGVLGCYDSAVPLSGDKGTSFDQRLVRNWVQVPEEGKKTEYNLAVYRFHDNDYFVIWSKEGKSKYTVFTRGFITDINGAKFMNIQDITSEEVKDRNYCFFRYEIDEQGNLVVQYIDKDSSLLEDDEFTTSKQLNEFVKKNKDNEKLYNKTKFVFKPAREFDLEIVLQPNKKF